MTDQQPEKVGCLGTSSMKWYRSARRHGHRRAFQAVSPARQGRDWPVSTCLYEQIDWFYRLKRSKTIIKNYLLYNAEVKKLVLALCLSSTAAVCSALVLLPPAKATIKNHSDVLKVVRGECYPSTNVVDITVLNASNLDFVGSISLTLAIEGHQEIITRALKLRTKREERLAFDFGPSICSHSDKLQLKTLSAN